MGTKASLSAVDVERKQCANVQLIPLTVAAYSAAYECCHHCKHMH